MFSKAPKNRKRRSRRKTKTETRPAWLDDSPASPKKPIGKRQQVYQLHAQIGAIESFIAKKNHADALKARMKEENILPPPEKVSRSGARAMTMAERRRYHAERSKNGLHFFLLFCCACGIGWWLIFSTL